MARQKQTTEQETINFIKNQPFLENFLIWHNEREDWVIAYKEKETYDMYELGLYVPVEKPYSVKKLCVGKFPGEYDETLSYPQKLPKAPV